MNTAYLVYPYFFYFLSTDYLFLGVPVNAGHQTIRLEYLPAAWPFWLQMVWVPGLLAALISLGLQRKGGA